VGHLVANGLRDDAKLRPVRPNVRELVDYRKVWPYFLTLATFSGSLSGVGLASPTGWADTLSGFVVEGIAFGSGVHGQDY